MKGEDRKLIEAVRSRAIRPGMVALTWQVEGRPMKAYVTKIERLRLGKLADDAGISLSQLLGGSPDERAKW